MDELELEKIYQELLERRGNSRITTTMPSGSSSIISGGAIGFDFTSLYPVQKRYYKLKQMIRRRKIERMFKNPS